MKVLLNGLSIMRKLGTMKNIGGRVLDPKLYVDLIQNPVKNMGQANIILSSLANKRFSRGDFQLIWKKYNYYIYTLYQLVSNSKLDDQMKFLQNVTIIYEKSNQVKSQNLIKIFNKVVNILLTHYKDLSLEQQIKLITSISRYNLKKAKAILTLKKTQIYSQLKQLNYQSAQELLQLMHRVNFIDTLLLEQSIDAIYPYISEITVQELCSMLYHLGFTQKFINYQFFIQTAHRLVALINSQKINDGELMKCISSISIIQKNMKNATLIDELDSLYEYAITYLNPKINTFRSNQLSTYSSIIRRSKYDDQYILQNLINETMARKVIQLEDNQEIQLRDNETINLQTLINIFHTMAVCSLSSKRFNDYVIGIIELTFKQFPLSKDFMSRLIWSACVLCSKQDVARLYPGIEKLYENQTLPVHQAMNVYYCYLYLKTFLPKITAHKNCFAVYFQKEELKSTISQSHLSVYETFVKCDIPCLKQFNVSNIMVDIMIPKWKSISNIVIDFHGYHHFLRKSLRPEGSNELKKKLLQSEGYHYYYVSIDEWNLANDKQQFIQKLIANIQEHIQKTTIKNKVIKK